MCVNSHTGPCQIAFLKKYHDEVNLVADCPHCGFRMYEPVDYKSKLCGTRKCLSCRGKFMTYLADNEEVDAALAELKEQKYNKRIFD
ncbi:hypothetical protein AAGS61_02145 [Lysinibacillus sp. KU-BSD001]|uniref:hypothetical protein n=1 Tax=Lysinibacillus sp. KU-BSD001 TaxID=3141328 RepID=UPI0036EAF581